MRREIEWIDKGMSKVVIYRITLYIVTAIVLLVIYVKYLENHSIFFPTKNIELNPESINLPFEDIFLETKDNIKINGWFIPYNNAKYTVLFCHGNAGNIADRLDKISLFHGLGVNIFIIDYRGYGRSQGKPSENGFYLDAKAGYDYLVNRRYIKPSHIILYGESLGGAVAIDLASKVEIGGLIAEGTFSTVRDMAKKFYPFLPSFLFSNKFDSLTKIKAVYAPKLFIHSKDDEIVPFTLAKKLYHAAGEPKQFVEIIGEHNTAFLDSGQAFLSKINSFIKGL